MFEKGPVTSPSANLASAHIHSALIFEGKERLLFMTTIDDRNLLEPRRALDKREAVRHLIHTAIRLIATMEDPFAIHLLIHSADKILIDIAKKNCCQLYI